METHMQQLISAQRIDRESLGDYAMNMAELSAYTGHTPASLYKAMRLGDLAYIDRGGTGDRRVRNIGPHDVTAAAEFMSSASGVSWVFSARHPGRDA